MATSGKFLGTQVPIYLNGKKVFNAIQKTADFTADMIEVTDDDTGGWKAFLPGDKGGTMTVEAHLQQQASVTSTYVSGEDLLDYWNNGTTLTVLLNTGSTGDMAFRCSALISKWNGSFPHGDKATYNFDLQLTGAITIATQSA